MRQPKHNLWSGDTLSFVTYFLSSFNFYCLIGVLLVWNKELFLYKLKTDFYLLRLQHLEIKLTPNYSEK